MKKLVLFLFIATLTFSVNAQEQKSTDNTTTYYLIRHAEKDKSDKTNRDPHLIKEGLKRAENWKNVLKNVKFDLVYSTDYNRTRETAKPTAAANNIEVTFYNPRDLKIEEFMAKTKGKTVLIVGHSNTTPWFTNALLGEQKYGPISEDNNSNIFIVTLSGDIASSTVLVVD